MPRAAFLILLPWLALAQPAPISLYLTVEDGDRLIGGLTEQNFRLYEDGRAVKFRLGEPETPAAITFLVEHSRASWLYQSDIDAAVRAFVDAAPEGHWYSLATFSHSLHADVGSTGAHPGVKSSPARDSTARREGTFRRKPRRPRWDGPLKELGMARDLSPQPAEPRNSAVAPRLASVRKRKITGNSVGSWNPQPTVGEARGAQEPAAVPNARRLLC